MTYIPIHYSLSLIILVIFSEGFRTDFSTLITFLMLLALLFNTFL